jgi:hypothetical protein
MLQQQKHHALKVHNTEIQSTGKYTHKPKTMYKKVCVSTTATENEPVSSCADYKLTLMVACKYLHTSEQRKRKNNKKPVKVGGENI